MDFATIHSRDRRCKAAHLRAFLGNDTLGVGRGKPVVSLHQVRILQVCEGLSTGPFKRRHKAAPGPKKGPYVFGNVPCATVRGITGVGVSATGDVVSGYESSQTHD